MNPREVAALSNKAIETGLTDLAAYLLKDYSVNTHFDRATNVLHAYVLNLDANTFLRLHLYFYYNLDGQVWYCVDTTGNGSGCILEYGCPISEVPNQDTATETDYMDAQIAKDSICTVINSFFDDL